MAKIVKKNKTKKTLPRPSRSLNSEEKFWDEVDTQAHYLIADILNQKLPLPNLRKKENLDLEKDADYRTLSFEYENNYSELEDLPEPKDMAEEIAYEYLLLVTKSLLKTLSDFSCHQPDYFTGLTEF
jgi:hypothetical protein